MNDAYYTQEGERPDLAALPVNPPEEYIGNRLIPIVPVSEKSGTIYYATITADDAAETGRVTGVAPSGTQISDSNTSYTAAEAVKRAQISPDEAKTMGGIEKADEVGAKWAKRQVMNAIEVAIRGVTLDVAASATFDPAKFFEQSQTALDSIRLYEGRKVLYGATMTLKKAVQQMLGDPTFGPVLARAIAGTAPEVAATGFNFRAWMNALAMMTGVDEVLAGDSNVWNDGSAAGKIGFAVIADDPDPMSHKWKPELGKCFQFMPDGESPWVIQSVPDRVNVNNLYDAYNWYNVIALNTGANYTIDGVLG